MHLRVGVIPGRVWAAGCGGGWQNTHTYTHIHPHAHIHTHTHFTISISRRGGGGGGGQRQLNHHHHTPPLHITSTHHHHHRTLTTNPPPPGDSDSGKKKSLENSDHRDDLGSNTPYQPAPREDPGHVGFFGAAAGLAGRGMRSISGQKEGEVRKPDDWNDILNRWYGQYQDFIGITDLKRAQDRVTELSDGLLTAQSERRRLQGEMESLQEQLVDNHQRITKTEQYSQEHMQLFSEARVLNERLRQVRSEFTEYERRERETFTHLSSAIRDCHERERMQAEQSKYWSIIASVVSAALASLITSVNNWVRIKEIKEHITTSHQTLLDGYERMQSEILTSLDNAPAPALPDTPAAPSPTPAAPVASPTSEEIAKLMEEFKIFSADVNQNLTSLADEVVTRLQSALNASPVDEDTPLPPLHPLASPGVAGNGPGVSGGEVSYGRVAASMIVGAGLGTLVTAFFLGALGGGAGAGG
ncbi:uncharacterized protein LOC127006400 [Eriocheir sinensis]|uniref:uncharacterized protein LOC127006400 n=1 Tax=Eriocheir sinensis TaxID=95602 RepID=UPI0021CAE1A5|nr:uncharacterized protein LOC127006400 [Eriocheir sinensis]XP_050732312.1 uncharacterized protein LOC127006400 [Eriocheir sinensis]